MSDIETSRQVKRTRRTVGAPLAPFWASRYWGILTNVAYAIGLIFLVSVSEFGICFLILSVLSKMSALHHKVVLGII